MAKLDLTFAAPGPIAAAFMASRNPVDAIMGPVGSAKTSTCIWRLMFTALEQAPHPVTRIRKFSFAAIRSTYRDLERTTIPSWLRWFPRELGSFTGGTGGTPAKHEMRLRLVDGTTLHLVAHFIGLGDQTIEQATRGLEVTAFYLNEADLLPALVLSHCFSRAGRDPAVDASVGFAGATWRGVILDCNAPDVDNWIYTTFIEHLPEGWDFFRQPSGLAPDAENLQNLPPGYYDEMVKSMPDWLARRLVRNEFGYSRDGKPVYPEWNDHLHVAGQVLLPTPGQVIALGLDAGLNPGAVWLQEQPDGQIRCLYELTGDNVGAETFGAAIDRVNASMFAKFDVEAWPDPAGFAKAPEATDERSWVQTVKNKTKLKMHRLPTNALMPRLEAVRQPLTRLIDGHRPGYLLSPSCRILRKGFNSGYRYRRLQISGTDRFADVPDKNEFSHPHDANQYGCMGIRGYAAVTGRQQRASDRARELGRRAQAVPYNPFAW